MEVQRKHLYWGAGLALGLAVIGGVVLYARKGSNDVKPSVPGFDFSSWIKPVPGQISSKFGYRINPISKLQQFHNGIDLPVPVNTHVKNPKEGTVLDVYTNKQGGNMLLIKHSDGLVSGYAHLTKALVKKGEKVKKSQVVALSGNTGKSTGPHVHFTLKNSKGDYLDPGRLLYA